MKKHHPASESAFFNPRVFAAFLLCSVGVSLAMFSFASTPSSGTLSEAAPVLTYDAGPFFQPNQSPLGLGQLDSGPRCNNTTFPCDNFTLTVTVPSDYRTTHPNASLKVTLYWTDTGSGQSDYDLYIYKGIVGDLSGSQQADYQAASGANPEVASVTPVVGGTSQYSLKIVPYTPLVRRFMFELSCSPVRAPAAGSRVSAGRIRRRRAFHATKISTLRQVARLNRATVNSILGSTLPLAES